MKRTRATVLSGVLAMAVIVSLFVSTSKVGATCGPAYCWTQANSVNPSTSNNILNSVYAISSKEIWAVGYYADSGNIYTLIEQGKLTGNSGGQNTYTWSRITSTNPSTTVNKLNGVAFARNDLSATDVWSVGYFYDNSASVNKTLIEKWNGTAWSTTTSPNPSSSSGSYLNAIAGNSASNYWAVGYYNNGTTDRTLSLHWDGSSWSVITTPNHGSYGNYLTSVTYASGNTVWAAGYYLDSSAVRHPLLLKYAAGVWVDNTSNLPILSNGSYISGIAFNGVNSGLAVGRYGTSSQPLVVDYNISGWLQESLSSDSTATLTGVDYITAGSVWVVGYDGNVPTSDYTGSSGWEHYTPVSVGIADRFLAVSGIAGNDTWAVGYTTSSSGVVSTLIEHFN